MEENFNKHLGNKLKLRRLAVGLTQTKVAKAINVTFQQIQKILRKLELKLEWFFNNLTYFLIYQY